MADMNCLNNEDQLDCDLSNEAEIASEMENVVEVTKKYEGSIGDEIKVIVDNEKGVISAAFSDSTNELLEGFANDLEDKAEKSEIPTKVSQLENDSNFATKEYVNTNGGKIDKILVNGTEQTITNKAVDIEVPTKLSELTNDKEFINNTVNNLVNYYTKSETYTKSEVLALLADIPKFSVQIVSTLPTDNISNTTIYLLAVTDSDLNNYYEEFLYINNSWELIGTTKIDLSNYYTKAETSELIQKSLDSLATVATTGSYNDLNDKIQPAAKENMGTMRAWVDEENYLCLSTKPPITASRVFSENSPEIISTISAEISQQGLTSSQVAETYGWNIGDSTSITLSTGEKIEIRIIGINHDDKSDGSGKAGITLQMVECLATEYPMNSTTTNVGGYAASKMKTETLPTIKALLPQEWQDVIKLVDKKSADGGSSNYSKTLTLSEDLFLLAEIEVFGAITYAQDGANEGSVYEYWNGKAAADRIKKYDKNADGVADTATHWWLRSAYSASTLLFCSVSTDGKFGGSMVNYPRGVAFGFCI